MATDFYTFSSCELTEKYLLLCPPNSEQTVVYAKANDVDI